MNQPFIAILIIILLIAFVIFLIRIPIMIAQRRGIGGRNLGIISLLSWLGIFLGITWVAALVLSLAWNGDTAGHADKDDKFNDLEKLHKLKKSGAITEQEFKAHKKKILED